MELFTFYLRTKERIWEYEQVVVRPFKELILSWNGFRPAGFWTFFVSLCGGTIWSPWLKYAEWGSSRQKTFHTDPEESFAKTYQDAVYPKTGEASAFRIRVQASEDTDLTSLHSLSVCCSCNIHSAPSEPLIATSLKNVPKQSQMVLDHPRYHDLCSPTSTAMAVNYLCKERIDPVVFAAASRDEEFDIYGNWILNTAAAYEALQGKYRTYVARLSSFSEALTYIDKGLPLVVSVKGPLKESPQPYANGHLMLLTGYDPIQNKVLCMDPGFSRNEETAAAYPLDSFLEAWGRRRNLAYLFKPFLES